MESTTLTSGQHVPGIFGTLLSEKDAALVPQTWRLARYIASDDRAADPYPRPYKTQASRSTGKVALLWQGRIDYNGQLITRGHDDSSKFEYGAELTEEEVLAWLQQEDAIQTRENELRTLSALVHKYMPQLVFQARSLYPDLIR
ncbi:hypothetical protein [Burkholderia cenocepacia]|uniref:hypothetical protein n=1 Tax=Burkholderia cenocepacia TaxID=95486 RepID=UPI00076C2858|nr:hypothetical protein [Burkholderia cenocepacia]KWU26443.1 hypothetical protein AS149_25995 [Burkholderia cenocepacia]